jgi:AcrR family transcriptional regulator
LSRSGVAGAEAPVSKTKKGAATRTRILDAAETLFAEHGYERTAMRDIAAQAGVEQGLISYYFRSKEALFNEALSRCVVSTLDVQGSALDRLLARAGTADPGVEEILHTYTESALAPLSEGDRRFVNVVRLSAQYVRLPQRAGVFSPIARHYGPLRERYLAALRRALPGLTAEEVNWGFSVFEAAYSHLMMDHSQEAQRRGVISPGQVAELRQRLAAFCASGFLGLRG